MADHGVFVRVTKWTSRVAGHPIASGAALGIILLWAVSGPIFGFNSTWQLVINTGTTIVTFLMVFLIQATQNRDSAAIQIKLDELLRSTAGADKTLLDLEEFSEDDLEELRAHYEKIAERARDRTESNG